MKKTLFDKVMDLYYDFTTKPYALTAMYSGISFLSTVSSGDLLPTAIFTGYGVAGDLMREALTRNRLKGWRNLSSNLERILDADGMYLLTDAVKKKHRLRGHPYRAEYMMKQQGTGIDDNGFLALLSLKYPKEEVKVLYKHNDKWSLRNGAFISDLLNDNGIEFVPQSYDLHWGLTKTRGALNRLSKKNKTVGQFYEFVEGIDLESMLPSSKLIESNDQRAKVTDEVFELMHTVYALDPRNLDYIHPDIFHNKHHSRLKNNLVDKKDDFVGVLGYAYKEFIKPLPKTLIHGDLHQGNILIGDKNWIIDWDNSQLGVPYHDFFHYAIHTDLISDPNYEQIKSDFLERQEQRLGKIPDVSLHLIETEISLAMLNRYYSAVTENKITEEYHDNLLHVCKKLENIAKNSWRKCLETSPANLEAENDFNKSYDSYVRNNYSLLDSITLDLNRSIAYAHSLNHKQTISLPHESGLKHYNETLHNVESLVVSDERRRNLFAVNAIIPAFWVFGFAGYAAHLKGIDVVNTLVEVNERYQPIILSYLSIGIGSALFIYNSDKILRTGIKVSEFVKDTAINIIDYFSSPS